jgi:hypothetical protein
MLLKAFIFCLIVFAITMVVGFFVAAIIKVIGSLLKGKEETAGNKPK